MTDTRIDLNLVVLAQIFQSLLKSSHRCHRYAFVFGTENTENGNVQGLELRFIIGDLAIIDNSGIKLVRKEQRSIQRPATTEAPAQGTDAWRTCRLL